MKWREKAPKDRLQEKSTSRFFVKTPTVSTVACVRADSAQIPSGQRRSEGALGLSFCGPDEVSRNAAERRRCQARAGAFKSCVAPFALVPTPKFLLGG